MIFSTLRMLGLLRRGVIALESLARSQATLASRITSREQRAATRIARRAKPSPTEFSFLDTAEIEHRYQEQLKRDSLELDRG